MTLHPYALALATDFTTLLPVFNEGALYYATTGIPDFTDHQKAEVYAFLAESPAGVTEEVCNKALWRALDQR